MKEKIIKHKKITFIILGGLLMMGGDYLTAYYDSEKVFFVGELLALIGWASFVLALEKQ